MRFKKTIIRIFNFIFYIIFTFNWNIRYFFFWKKW